MDLIHLKSSQYVIIFKMDGYQSQFLVLTQTTQFRPNVHYSYLEQE